MTLIINVNKKPNLPVVVNVIPNPGCVVINGTLQLVAVVENATNTNVTWTLLNTIESPGSITEDGLYTAPGDACIVTARVVPEADVLKYVDVTINVKATAAECCDPLVDVYPRSATVMPGSDLRFDVYLDGVDSSPTGVTWSVITGGAGGTVTSGGVYTAPTGFYNTVGSDTVRATVGGCYDESEILVSNSLLGISVTPKFLSVYPNQTATYSAEVIGSDNQNVQWSIVDYGYQSTYPITYTPTGFSDSDAVFTAPTGVPANPYVRVRATSAISNNLWDEATLYIVGLDLPLDIEHCTKYLRREGRTITDPNDPSRGSITDPTDPVQETIYQESDPYKGYTALPLTEVNSSTSSWAISVTDGVWPDGTATNNYIWMTAYDSVTTPADPPNLLPEYSALAGSAAERFAANHVIDIRWSRRYKIPEWEKIFLTVDLPNVTSGYATFSQHDFETIGTAVEVITGNTGYEELEFLPTGSTSVTFVYYAGNGFFGGTQGEAFDPVAAARDVVTFSAISNGSTFSKTLYFRPEPDLPEVFPELVGPEIGLYSYYLPGDVPYPMLTDIAGSPITYNLIQSTYMGEEYWNQLHVGCLEECPAPSWVGQQYNQLVTLLLPYELKYLPYTDVTISTTNKIEKPSYFIHYYHGMWAAAVPAVALYQSGAMNSGLAGSLGVTSSEASNVGGVPRVSTSPTVSTSASSPTSRNTKLGYVTGETQETSTGEVTNTVGTTSLNAGALSHEIKLKPIYNRHFMSYITDLTPKRTYPKDVKFEVLAPTTRVTLDADVYHDYRKSTLSTNDCTLSTALGRETTFKSTLQSFTGPAKMAYIKVTPNIFGGTYDKSVIFPIFLYGVVTHGNIHDVENLRCYTNIDVEYHGMHLHTGQVFADLSMHYVWNSNYPEGLSRIHGMSDGVSDTAARQATKQYYTPNYQPVSIPGMSVDKFVMLEKYVAGNGSIYNRIAKTANVRGLTQYASLLNGQGITSMFGILTWGPSIRPGFTPVQTSGFGGIRTSGTSTPLITTRNL